MKSLKNVVLSDILKYTYMFELSYEYEQINMILI